MYLEYSLYSVMQYVLFIQYLSGEFLEGHIDHDVIEFSAVGLNSLKPAHAAFNRGERNLVMVPETDKRAFRELAREVESCHWLPLGCVGEHVPTIHIASCKCT
jgi:hypothetical protein